ncbi:MAG: tRNA (adenosine(37)-N6)-threonylcarbamoyltransferase complex ATPase subunit type 1 TsaE [Flavobacteriales bacterium]
MSALNRSIHDLAELEAWAKDFIGVVKAPAVIQVLGDMGSGKTTTIGAICRSLGHAFDGSPTFALVQEYRENKKTTIIHFDLYRVRDVRELVDIGFSEYLDQNALIFIEWPQIAEPFLQENTRSLRITQTSGIRMVELSI